MSEREDWPVHQPAAPDAPIPGRRWYSGCEPADYDSERGHHGPGPRVRPIEIASYGSRDADAPPGMIATRPKRYATVYGADGRIGDVIRSFDDYAVVRWHGRIPTDKVPWSELYPLRPGSLGECEGCGEKACPACGAGLYPDGGCQCPEVAVCAKCGTLLDDDGLCGDETCPYSDRPQGVPYTEG